MASTTELMQMTSPKEKEVILNNLCKIVDRSTNGSKRDELLKAACVAGGYIAGGLIDEYEATNTLQTAIRNKPGVDDLKIADDAINNGIQHGKTKPIYKLEMFESAARNYTGAKIPQKQKTLSDFDHLRITEKSDIPEPEPILMLSGEIIAVNGDIFTLSGASKSGKSAVCGMSIAATLYADGICPDAIEGLQMKPNPEKKAILHFDTEQAAHKHKTNLLSILRRAKLSACPDNLLSYNIRKLPLDEYAATTTSICEGAVKKFYGIHSIWIDGGADYVADVNDQAASNQIVKYFEDLAIRYNTAVFLIVHTNPGGDKERGHFGSQCQRKSGGILTVKQENDISFVEAKILRYAGKGDIQKLSFIYDKEKGYHIGSGVKIEVDPEAKRREKKINEAQEICDQIFSGQRSYQYKDALSAIARITLKSERTNKDIFTIADAFSDPKWKEFIKQKAEEYNA